MGVQTLSLSASFRGCHLGGPYVIIHIESVDVVDVVGVVGVVVVVAVVGVAVVGVHRGDLFGIDLRRWPSLSSVHLFRFVASDHRYEIIADLALAWVAGRKLRLQIVDSTMTRTPH